MMTGKLVYLQDFTFNKDKTFWRYFENKSSVENGFSVASVSNIPFDKHNDI